MLEDVQESRVVRVLTLSLHQIFHLAFPSPLLPSFFVVAIYWTLLFLALFTD